MPKVFLVFLLLLVSCAEKPAAVEFTQCIVAPEMKLDVDYYVDEERGCLGQRWRMPREVFVGRSDANFGEFLKIRLPKEIRVDTNEPAMAAGETIMIMANMGDPVGLLDAIVETNKSTFNLAEKASHSSSLRFLEAEKTESGSAMVLVLPRGRHVRYVAICIFAFDVESLPIDHTPCAVRSLLGDKVFARYSVAFGQMDSLPSIHKQLVEQISNYMADNK